MLQRVGGSVRSFSNDGEPPRGKSVGGWREEEEINQVRLPIQEMMRAYDGIRDELDRLESEGEDRGSRSGYD